MKVIILHSGGLDSTVCLLKAKAAGHEAISLSIDYGQRHRVELTYAEEQCRRHQFLRRTVRVEWTKPYRPIPEGRTVEEMRADVSPAFLPGRNALFLAVAFAEAAGVGAEEVWIGVNAVEFSGYPDCRPEFIEAFGRMAALAIPNGPRLVAPLLHLTKPQIASEAALLGLKPGDTWSCYQPMFALSGLVPCGTCDACILHHHAWASVGAEQQSKAAPVNL